MVQRAVTGSMDRCLGVLRVLIENGPGAFPFWLAPEQARVLPVADRHEDYAERVRERLREEGLRVDVDARGESVGRRIRDGEVAKVPYLLVVGDREADSGTVSARARGEGDLGALALEELAARLADEARGG